MSLYDIAVARKLSGGGGGGGGSSIVHPVNITFVNNTADGLYFAGQFGDPMNGTTTGFFINGGQINSTFDTWAGNLQSGTTVMPTVYCLDGGKIYIADVMSAGYTYAISGDAVKTEVSGMDTIVVSGDCTITVS